MAGSGEQGESGPYPAFERIDRTIRAVCARRGVPAPPIRWMRDERRARTHVFCAAWQATLAHLDGRDRIHSRAFPDLACRHLDDLREQAEQVGCVGQALGASFRDFNRLSRILRRLPSRAADWRRLQGQIDEATVRIAESDPLPALQQSISERMANAVASHGERMAEAYGIEMTPGLEAMLQDRAGLMSLAGVNVALLPAEGIRWTRSVGLLPKRLRPVAERRLREMRPLSRLSGLGLYRLWESGREIVAVPWPVVHRLAGDLHREDGPAVWWPGGDAFWLLEGVEVPRIVVERPARITVERIDAIERPAARRIAVERFGGWRRYFEVGGGRPVARDDSGILWRRDRNDGPPTVMVEVRNATAEPDGTHRQYFLAVPPEVETARQAVAWTFGLESDAYAPIWET